ncbi:hypothetical protein HELRODRAFT_82775 [Helobdella robusta]|uniref:Sulfotransferase domain-containing protein n=1 Tax=Helobdella robusta TaxID=6412 RepID=T1G4W3_HELRO|nr:hypothetical protein HELRODRAFT_82775 [Helobdella robusta]ESO00554.1 hypothetical protein HELRODRAFT_82775 [Helobdella robusta]
MTQRQQHHQRNQKQDLKRRLPQCLIIGARKSGTSRALLEFLSLHSSIKAQKREVHFFDSDENFAKGFDWYRQQMPTSLLSDITIEKTPAYFVKDKVPHRVHLMSNNISLLLILRNPVYRTLSDYTQLKLSRNRRGFGYPSFETFAFDAKTQMVRKNYKAIRRSIYHRHFKKWLKYFKLSQIHIINGDNFIKNPLFEMRKVEKFLNLKNELTKQNFYLNASRNFYCMRLRNETTKCLHSSKGRSYKNLSYDSMNKLVKFFRGHNRRFYKLVGVDFNWERSVRMTLNKIKKHANKNVSSIKPLLASF